MNPASQPIDRDVLTGFRLGDEGSLERLFRERYAALTGAAQSELGADGAASAPKVVERVFVRAWEERASFETPEALDTFLRNCVRDTAVRERSRIASLHRFEAREGVTPGSRARAIEPLTPEEAWKHINAMLHAPAHSAEVRHKALDESRHHAAEHLAATAKSRPIAVPAVIAGVVAVAIFGGLWWVERNSEETALASALAASDSRTISSRIGQVGSTTLSDGSRVTVGADSRLTIAASYGTALRALKLEGAASFEVEPRASEPFAVRVRDVTVRAVGTAFDIVAYPGDPAVLVRVRSGTVTVKADGDPRRVEAGRAVAVDADGAVRDAAGPALAERMAWADKRFVVNAKPLRDVLPLVTRWYGIELKVPDAALLTRPVTVDVPLESSREVITAIERSATLKFDYEGKTMVLRDAAQSASR